MCNCQNNSNNNSWPNSSGRSLNSKSDGNIPQNVFYRGNQATFSKLSGSDVFSSKYNNISNANGISVWIPENSNLVYNTNGVRSYIEIHAPNNYKYVGFDDKREVFIGAIPCISCSCNHEGDTTGMGACNPALVAGKWTCESNHCPKCSAPQMVRKTDWKHYSSGGFIDLTQEVVFLNRNSSLPAAFEAMFELREVNNLLNNFIQKIYGGNSEPQVTVVQNKMAIAPIGYKMVMINLCGRATVICVPDYIASAYTTGGDVSSCSCSAGSHGACHFTTTPRRGCYGDCSGTCTYCTGYLSPGGHFNPVYEAISYNF